MLFMKKTICLASLKKINSDHKAKSMNKNNK